MSELLFDARKPGDTSPGLHALIVGVGGYPNLPPAGSPQEPVAPPRYNLKKLSSSVPSALRVARLLLRHGGRFGRPLRTCRLLLSPLGTERGLASVAGKGIPEASFENLCRAAEGWRADASASPDGMTLFYFSGHGIQRTRERRPELLALLHGFGGGPSPTFHHAFAAEDLRASMNPGPGGTIARDQLYMFDACRYEPQDLGEAGYQRARLLLDYQPSAVDTRNAPIFYTTLPGLLTPGISGRGSVFAAALTSCLRGAAGVRNPAVLTSGTDQWTVTLESLRKLINYYVERIGARANSRQTVQCDGATRDLMLRTLDGPPRVRVHLGLKPSVAAEIASIFIESADGQRLLHVGPPIPRNPHVGALRAGIYTFGAEIKPPSPPYRDSRRVFLDAQTPCQPSIADVKP